MLAASMQLQGVLPKQHQENSLQQHGSVRDTSTPRLSLSSKTGIAALGSG